MKNKKWNLLFYLHAVVFLWALLFALSLFRADGGNMAGTLAIGNVAFLLFNIPFAVVTLLLKSKGYFSKKYAVPMVIISVLNIIVGILAWIFAILIIRMP